MNQHSTHCTNCNHATISAEQILMYGVRWACPTCGDVIDFSQKQLAQPGLSQDAKAFWSLIGGAAVIFGVALLADRLTA